MTKEKNARPLSLTKAQVRRIEREAYLCSKEAGRRISPQRFLAEALNGSGSGIWNAGATLTSFEPERR